MLCSPGIPGTPPPGPPLPRGAAGLRPYKQAPRRHRTLRGLLGKERQCLANRLSDPDHRRARFGLEVKGTSVGGHGTPGGAHRVSAPILFLRTRRNYGGSEVKAPMSSKLHGERPQGIMNFMRILIANRRHQRREEACQESKPTGPGPPWTTRRSNGSSEPHVVKATEKG